MISPFRFLLCLLFLSFLQPWKLVASTPGGEEILESLIEKASSFFEDAMVEENVVPLPLNTIQVAPRTIEEGAFRETFPRDTHSITDPKNLGDRIMELPADLFGGFLRSPKAKQDAYKAEYEQVVQELQTQYPLETHPELAQKIATWNQAVASWCGCSGSEEKDSCYEEVKNLAFRMPQELYRLVALSQAMKIMEDATAYSQYLPLALEKYNVDRDRQGTEEAKVAAARSKAILLGRLDNINNNIKKLEEVADTIVRLSEQKNHCLASASTARTAALESAIVTRFEEASGKVQEAIDCYLQYGQKMKEGDAPSASQLRLQGRILECGSLHSEYRVRALQATAEGNFIDSQNFLRAAESFINASDLLREVSEYRKSGKLEVLLTREGTAQLWLQAVQALANRNGPQAEGFLITQHYYHYQMAQALANGNGLQVENFSRVINNSSRSSSAPKDSSECRQSGAVEALQALEEGAQYYLQAAKAFINGNRSQAESFSKAARTVHWASIMLAEAFDHNKSGKVDKSQAVE